MDAKIADLAIFVGKNDCGKSNILRALNLFFNDETNPGSEFDFDEDYNFFAPVRARKAKEVVVQIEVDLPRSYHATNGHVVVWKKRWRQDGLWGEENDYFGQRITRNQREREVREDVKLPDKSNVHALLRKIEFEYVPAIKDADYFDDLRGRIYGIISEVAARRFHESSAAFEQAIGDHLEELTTSITSTLGFDTRLALPRDLYHIFERLDFLSGDNAISLDNRGDGVKARHIPLILRFMAEKKAALQRRGGPPISSIWAYEEPENNLEFASAVQLADEIKELAVNETAQILLTTHSPAFYDLAEQDNEIELHFVSREIEQEGTLIKSTAEGIDESLGTLAMLAPRITEMVAEVRNQEAAKAAAAQLAEANCPTIFVEGESDRLVVRRSLELFYPEVANDVRVETKREGAGHSYVIDMLIGWRSQHKHHPERPKAAGIVDGDAKYEKTEFNKQPDNVKSAKCFVYPAPEKLRAANAAHFKVPATLETMYPQEIWTSADENGHLVGRNLRKVCHPNLVERIIEGETTFDDELHEAWAYLVKHDFAKDTKVATATQLCGQSDQQCGRNFAELRPLLNETLTYLGFDLADD